MKNLQKIDSCRLCKNKQLVKVLDFGSTPPANSFLKKNQLKHKEFFYPLAVNFCSHCGQLQLSHVVSPEILFRDYVFVSSTSSVTVEHFRQYATSVFKKLKLKRNDLVVDLGSNDGVLLRPFKKLGAKVLGIDPARNVAARATRDGIETLPYFFTEKIASQISKKYGKAKVITGNNVFAHIHDLDEIMYGVIELLADGGVFIIEAPYNIYLLEKNLFDIIYHEHLSYISVRPLVAFFKRFGLQIFSVSTTSVHGGSVRIFIKKTGAKYKVKPSVQKFLNLEKNRHLSDLQTYHKFARKVEENKIKLSRLLNTLKKNNKTIAGYGAPAKSTTLLHYFNIGAEVLDFIVDDSPYKQGLFTPGKHIPVVAPREIYTRRPDYLLILAWNFADSIMKIHNKYKKLGGKFIIPVPDPSVI